MKKLQVMIVGIALAAASSASASLMVVIDTPNPSQIVDINVDPGSSAVPKFSGAVYAGIYNETISDGTGPGVVTPSFCIDVAHDVYIGEKFNDYSCASLAGAPDAPAGPMGAAIATDIEELWAAYFSEAQTDSKGVMAAALQVAIWEVEGGGQNLGNGDPGYTVTAYGNTAVTAETGKMIDALDSGTLTDKADLEAIVSPDGQSYVIAVPEASTVIAGGLLLLPFVAGTIKKLWTRRAA